MKHGFHTSMVLTLVLSCGSAAGCYSELDIDSHQLDIECPPDHCGVNASTVNDLPFGELHLADGQNNGLANFLGLYISGFTGPQRTAGQVLQAHKGRFTVLDGYQTLVGNELLGSTITVSSTESDEVIEVLIDEYRDVPSWTTSGFKVDMYRLKTLDAATGEYEYACTDANTLAGDEEGWAVVITRERYSVDNITVVASGREAHGWFNITCAGHALAKMKLLGYDPDPRANNPYSSTRNRRQATLKMIAGDYCGTGVSFTEDGTSVYWRNHAGWATNNPPMGSPSEARWDLDGAVCLDAPRLGADEVAAIQSECAAVGRTLGSCEGNMDPYLWTSSLAAAP